MQAPMTISEELERLGEDGIDLVVAHDQARGPHAWPRNRPTVASRMPPPRGAITAQAKRRLHELDNETDAVWRERTRLLVEDARGVGAALIALAEEAAERFPAAGLSPTEAVRRVPAEAESPAVTAPAFPRGRRPAYGGE